MTVDGHRMVIGRSAPPLVDQELKHHGEQYCNLLSTEGKNVLDQPSKPKNANQNSAQVFESCFAVIFHVSYFLLFTSTCFSKVSCIWSEWEEWTKCSKSCNGGKQKRGRTTVQKAQHGGNECDGDNRQYETCNEDPCPGPGLD